MKTKRLLSGIKRAFTVTEMYRAGVKTPKAIRALDLNHQVQIWQQQFSRRKHD
jgi:hypothetical protein